MTDQAPPEANILLFPAIAAANTFMGTASSTSSSGTLDCISLAIHDFATLYLSRD